MLRLRWSLATLAVLGAVACGGCPTDEVECAGQCVNLADDPAHCGACGMVCEGDQVCGLGRCACPVEGERLCGETCLDTRDDNANCGACGNACPEGTACTDGTCACPPGLEACRGACVRFDDDANCGACGFACPADQSCVAGACACSAGLALCDGACAELISDPAHCGACGTRCAAPRDCVAGSCECAEGTWCGADCVDLQASSANCGGCGRTCGGAACFSGRCVPQYRWHTTRPSGGDMFVGRVEWDGRVAIDDGGTVYLAWSWSGGAAEVAAFDPDGALRWTREVASAAERVGDVVALPSGGVAVSVEVRTVATSTDVLVVAYEADGAERWRRRIASGGVDRTGGLAARGDRLAIAGSLGGSFDFGGGTLVADTFRDAFVTLVDAASGAHVAAGVWGRRGTERPVYASFAPDGDVIVAGYSGAGVDFGGGPTSTVTGGFLARLGPDLVHRWSRAVGASDIHGAAMSGDTIYLTGQIERATDWGDGVGFEVGPGRSAAFLLAVDSTTGTSRWAEGIDGNFSAPGSRPAVDTEGRVWFGTSTGAGRFEAEFIARADASAPFHRQTFAASDGRVLATGVATNGARLAFAGRFDGSLTLGGVPETPSDFDVFVVVFDL
ncbi:MAG: hypothetical protein AB8I08_20265 [Sandaracinaceae bacterium]